MLLEHVQSVKTNGNNFKRKGREGTLVQQKVKTTGDVYCAAYNGIFRLFPLRKHYIFRPHLLIY